MHHRFMDHPMTWYEAKLFCNGLGAKLLEIDSSAENKAILGEIKKRGFHRQKKHFWLGLTDRRQEGEWVLESTLKQPRFTNWARGQPDGSGWFRLKDEDCAYIKANTKWNDWNCWEKRVLSWTRNALCEKSS